MKRKSVAFVTLLALSSIASLVSCGGESGNKITLKIGFWPTETETKDVAMYSKWAEEFETAYPQYKIRGVPYTYNTQDVALKFATNALPDVWATWFTEPEKLKKSGFIRPVTSALQQFGWDEKMDPEMRQTMTFGGEIYGIPRDGYGLGLVINKRILGENNLLPEDGKGGYSIYNLDGSPAYPATWQQVYDWSNTIVNENGDASKGFLMYSANKQGGWIFSNIAWNYGAKLQVQEPSGKWKAHLDCPEAIAALEWIKQMKVDDLLGGAVTSVYDDWVSNIGSSVAMAVVGSDALPNAQLKGSVPMSDLAFVPMPSGANNLHYSLYGGSPFVFTKNVSDEKVEGILRFFDYIGRSPSVSETNMKAKKEGYEVAKAKNQPILPSIMPWTDSAYLEQAKALEDEYISVDMKDYSPFFGSIQTNKHGEEPNSAQDMYDILDTAIASIFQQKENANPKALLETANSKFQAILDKTVNQ